MSETTPGARMRLLDLFCGGGGASEGYTHAGFEVMGIDLKSQPEYPFDFMRDDALEVLKDAHFVMQFDAIHASPPCQQFTRARHLRTAQRGKSSTPDLIGLVRYLLSMTGKPHVIENVVDAPLTGIVLCGSHFGLRVRRHRKFECNFPVSPPPLCRHKEQGRPVGVYHVMNDNIPCGGRTARTISEAQQAMGIGWIYKWETLKEAIPPAYTEWVGQQLMPILKDRVANA